MNNLPHLSRGSDEQQKLEISDEYEMFFDGPLTEEEKELVNQLKIR